VGGLFGTSSGTEVCACMCLCVFVCGGLYRGLSVCVCVCVYGITWKLKHASDMAVVLAWAVPGARVHALLECGCLVCMYARTHTDGCIERCMAHP